MTTIREKIISIYNSGYHAGHNDTVEGQYVDIVDQDMQSYHEDIVNEICLDIGIRHIAEAELLKIHKITKRLLEAMRTGVQLSFKEMDEIEKLIGE